MLKLENMAGQELGASDTMSNTSDRYTTVVKQVQDVSESERQKITTLYLKYYEGSNANLVEQDLAKKSEIILLLYDKQIVGFTTLEFYSHQWNHQLIRVVFSGDTIIDKQHWGRQTLTFACISRMGWYKQQQPDVPVYWFLIVKGHRTYKYLPVFVKSFYPHWEYESQSLKSIVESLVIEKFGEVYNPSTGVLEFHESQGHLKQAYAYPDEREIDKPSVKYFLQRNPGYIKGHELVCLCELAAENMKPLTRRVFEKAVL
jgi:hypothetical protein